MTEAAEAAEAAEVAEVAEVVAAAALVACSSPCDAVLRAGPREVGTDAPPPLEPQLLLLLLLPSPLVLLLALAELDEDGNDKVRDQGACPANRVSTDWLPGRRWAAKLKKAGVYCIMLQCGKPNC